MCGVVMALVIFTGVPSVAATTPDTSDIDFLTELTLREEFPASDFIFKFPTEQKTAFGNLRNLFVNNDPILATLPNGGVAQNLVTLGPCAVNQPHSHPRGTEISHVTEGMLCLSIHTIVAQSHVFPQTGLEANLLNLLPLTNLYQFNPLFRPQVHLDQISAHEFSPHFSS